MLIYQDQHFIPDGGANAPERSLLTAITREEEEVVKEHPPCRSASVEFSRLNRLSVCCFTCSQLQKHPLDVKQNLSLTEFSGGNLAKSRHDPTSRGSSDLQQRACEV